MNKELTIEQAFSRLNEVVAQMESGKLSLEDSFLLYKEGIELLEGCSRSIEQVEQKIEVLNKEGEPGEF